MLVPKLPSDNLSSAVCHNQIIATECQMLSVAENVICCVLHSRGRGCFCLSDIRKLGKSCCSLLFPRDLVKLSSLMLLQNKKKKSFCIANASRFAFVDLVAVRYMELHDFSLKFIKKFLLEQVTCVLLTLILSAFCLNLCLTELL